ncbi:MAG: hypothetical protein H0W70_15000, partial [Actinobacteria bacterium]|nr:hypothetical protein [Actinomycetota bacterium]
MKLAVAGLACALGLATVLAAGPAVADDDSLGAAFQSFSLGAVAGGQRIIADSITGQSPGTVDSGIPDAETTMTSSSGHALASIAWPSALAGNAGSLLLLLGPFPCTPSALFDALGLPITTICSPVGVRGEVMDQYHYLNSPVRAEALNPGKSSDENTVPGGKMTARAGPSEVAADAVLGAVLVSDVEQAGTSRATSAVKVTGPKTAVADARSAISDIAFAGGEVTIGSVMSVAHGETDGAAATSSGATTVHDMKVHGIPVTVDNKGVHASDQTADAVGPATAAANQALAGFGITMYVTRPTQMTKGALTTFDAGSLIIDWQPPGAPGGVVFEFGGAHVVAAATLPFDELLGDTPSAADAIGGAAFSPPSLAADGGGGSGGAGLTAP